MKRIAIAGFAAAMLAQAASAAPVQPVAGWQWRVDWGDSRCSLIRETPAPGPAAIVFRLVPGTKVPDVMLFGTLADQAGKAATITFEPSGSRLAGAARRSKSGEQSVMWIDGLAGPDATHALDQLAASEAVVVQGARVPTAGAAAAVEALRKCSDAVLKDWGLDPQALAAAVEPPRGDAGQWVRPTDFGEVSFQSNAGGAASLVVVVRPDGSVRDCKLVESSGSAEIDRRACDLVMQRARFQPALDASGKPVVGITETKVSWFGR